MGVHNCFQRPSDDGRFFVLRIGNNFFGGLKMKTIKSLSNANKKVYVRMRSDEICRQFFAQAETEGFTFGGEKPTAKQPSDLIAVLPDKTICYVGTIGRIASRSGAENVVVVEADALFAPH
jgi:hypothetical protein